MTRDDILAASLRVHEETAAFWRSLAPDAFFQPVGTAWSPADNVRHLVKATRPVVLALGLPRILLRLRFGRPARRSDSYEALKSRYLETLAAGGGAGRFAPSPRVEVDQAAGRARILHELDHVDHDLRGAVSRWSDAALDRYQLPHPLLGNLTLREMLFFTLYHHQHHMEAVKRRLGRQSQA